MTSRPLLAALAGTLIALSATPAMAQDPLVKPVHFAKGTSSSTIRDTIRGEQYIDYKLVAQAGQTMKVELKTSNGSNYFNILPPGSSAEALFIGSTSGNRFSGQLAADGEYTVRVYLMRSAARRGESASFTLNVGIDGGQLAVSHDAKVKGTNYHATGELRCSFSGTPTQCHFGVERIGRGAALVTITRPGGQSRTIYFGHGKVDWSDRSQAEKNMPFKAGKQGDSNLVTIGIEQYEIPDAVIFGG
ncbi:hypothetical protein [Chitinilyticum aquatile]|uniref:hypothetical protein n=1 Tax=Chitinilyticum aquatile TaxID=362520 RepID=UPI0004070093|nr:hypothetical protein [Chitinilyticum aquatile]